MAEEVLSDVLQIGDKTLTMYAGVIVKIDEAIDGFDGLDDLTMNPRRQFELVKAVVTKYNEDGNPEGYIINPSNIKSDDFQKIYEWGLNHYQVFMLNSSTKTMKMLKNLQEKIREFPTNS